MNVIICLTPLQVFITEKIIELHKNEKFCLISIDRLNNEKMRHLHERVSKKCFHSKYYKINSNSLSFFKKESLKLKLFFFFRLIKIDKIFVSSIDSIHIQSFTSTFNSKDLYTFDDGLANITKTGYFYDKQYSDKITKKIRKRFKINDTLSSIKKKSIIHYTIYKDCSNIIDKTKFINLLPNNLNTLKPTEVKRIFIGQPIFEKEPLGNKKNIKETSKAIKRTKSELYFPHPRETYKIPNIKYIDTPLIFEDWIVKQLEQNPNTKYEVYSFFSSVIFNIQNIKNIEVISYHPKKTPKYWETSYQLVKKFNLKIIHE